MIENYALYIIILCSFVIHFLLIYLTKNVCYFGPFSRTDNEKIVKASNEIKILNWPSRMHSIKYNRSQLREYWTIFLYISKYG